MKYEARQPHGHRISRDPYVTLMADADGVGYVHCGDGVLVVPLTGDGQVLLGVERSPALDSDVLGLVGGEVKEGEALEETANRELQEELGWRAQRVDFLGELHPFKYLASRHFAFLARGLVPNKLKGDERHPVGTRQVELDRFPELVTSGELHDTLTIAVLCLAGRFLAQEDC